MDRLAAGSLMSVDMTLSRRGDYVTRAALFLARAFEEGGYRKIRELVVDTEVPATFAAQILADLVRAQLVTSKAGKQGGYRLTREPSAISVLEVIEAAEGPLRAERCALGSGPCRWDQVCPLHETWSEATSRLRTVLAETSLAELARRDRAIAAGAYEVPSDAHRSHPSAVEVSDRAHVELGSADTHLALTRISTQLGELLGTPEAYVSIAADRPPRRRTPPQRYLTAWRLTAPDRLGHFEGDLTVVDIDEQRCELQLHGIWHRDGPLNGETPSETRERARRIARAFLRNLARTLETV